MSTEIRDDERVTIVVTLPSPEGGHWAAEGLELGRFLGEKGIHVECLNFFQGRYTLEMTYHEFCMVRLGYTGAMTLEEWQATEPTAWQNPHLNKLKALAGVGGGLFNGTITAASGGIIGGGIGGIIGGGIGGPVGGPVATLTHGNSTLVYDPSKYQPVRMKGSKR